MDESVLVFGEARPSMWTTGMFSSLPEPGISVSYLPGVPDTRHVRMVRTDAHDSSQVVDPCPRLRAPQPADSYPISALLRLLLNQSVVKHAV